MPPPNRNARYRTVRGLSRGLSLLAALNLSSRGQASSTELGKLTGLHRTTVRRLLETLSEEGYVTRSESDDSFRLTRKVRRLSDGFTNYDRLSSIAMPIMGALMQKVVWPSSFCLPDSDAMHICESTHRFSPLSFHRGATQMRIPYLSSAAGRAYFSFCGKGEQDQILHILKQSGDWQAKLASDPVFIDNLVRTVQARGYSTNFSEWEAEKKVGAVAMPIFRHDRVVGSLTIIFLAHVLNPDQAIHTFLDPLKAAVSSISTQLNQDLD